MPGRPRRMITVTTRVMKEQVQSRIDYLQDEIDALQGEIDALQEQLKVLDRLDVTIDVPVWKNRPRARSKAKGKR